MASFKAKFPVLQELFAKNHRGAFGPPSQRGEARQLRRCLTRNSDEMIVNCI